MIELLQKFRTKSKLSQGQGQDQLLKKYFSENYFEAREKFRSSAKTKNMNQWSETIDEDLTVDFAYCRSNSEKLLIIVSGVHGVEGYAGSALQLLFLDRLYEYYRNSFSLLLIHSYNPYGFKHNRRVNENNVDLNRNCLEDYNSDTVRNAKVKEVILKNKKIFSPESPRKNRILEESNYSLALAKLLLRHGMEGTIQVGSYGQNVYPKGVGYIGLQEEKSTKIFKETLQKFTPQFQKTILLDIHTGLGRRNSISTYAENPANSEDFLLLKQAIKNIKSRKIPLKGAMSHNGAITEFFYNSAKSDKKISIIMEIGTVSHVAPALSLATLSRANLDENQITHFGPKKNLEKARQRLKKAYYPKAQRYRRVILSKSERMLDNLCKQIEKI